MTSSFGLAEGGDFVKNGLPSFAMSGSFSGFFFTARKKVKSEHAWYHGKNFHLNPLEHNLCFYNGFIIVILCVGYSGEVSGVLFAARVW